MIKFKRETATKVRGKFPRIFMHPKPRKRHEPILTDAEIEEIRKKLDIKLPDKNPHGYSNGL